MSSDARRLGPLALLLALVAALPGVAAQADDNGSGANRTPEGTSPPPEDVASETERWVAITLLGAAAVFLLVVLRIAFILASNPIGEVAQELIYLRMPELRVPATSLLLVLVVETAELVLPYLAYRGLIPSFEEAMFFLNLAQAVFLLVTALGLLMVLRHYTTVGLERRIDSAMTGLAQAQGQRRRRRLE